MKIFLYRMRPGLGAEQNSPSFSSISVLTCWSYIFQSICLPEGVSSVTQSCPTLWDPMNCTRIPSITNSRRLLKLLSITLVMPSYHLILCHPFLLPPSIVPSIRVFPISQLFASGGQSIGVSASASVLPTNFQDWFPLGMTGWISLQSKGL